MDYSNGFLKLLVSKSMIEEKELPQISRDAKDRDTAEYLITEGIVAERDVMRTLSEYLGEPFAEMDMLSPDSNLLRGLSVPYLKEIKCVPVRIETDGALTVAIGNPTSVASRTALSCVYGMKKNFVTVPPSEIDAYLDSLRAESSKQDALDTFKDSEAAPHEDGATFSYDVDIADSPAVKLVDSVIREAVPKRASDIHIEPYENRVRIRYRIDGELRECASFDLSHHSEVSARLKVIAKMNIAERRVPQDGRINMNIGGADYDFRVSSIPTVWGEKFVIRILDKSAFSLTRSELGFSPEANLLVDKILARPHGIVLLSGPTGCGKTTTLYSFLRELNRPEVNITTVEDPVEYMIDGVNQIAVNVQAERTFASSLRSILRQDPDIIMIGEIRDEETAQIAIRASITGHLVFSTIHTGDAAGAVNRLVNMGVSDYLVGDALVAVIAQRLVKKLCPQCKTEVLATDSECDILGVPCGTRVYKPCGCAYCGGTGYKGRVAVHEILYMTDELRDAISHGASSAELRHIAIAGGMTTLASSCRALVKDGVTSFSELSPFL